MKFALTSNSALGTRKANQDRLGHSERSNSVLMVLADGLGGYTGGELAAQALVDTVLDFYDRTQATVIKDPARFIVLAVSYAHNVINKSAADRGIAVSLPRTTCIACLVQNGYAYWGHVGDSRLYHYRGRKLMSRTMDHTTVDQMFHEGVISADELHLAQGQLLRCVGGPKRPVVTLGAEVRLERNDRLILCSDGIWRAYRDHALGKVMEGSPLDETLEDVFSGAQRFFKRDQDNMSAILFEWLEDATEADPLYDLDVPQLDQKRLWKQASRAHRKRSDPDRRERSPTAAGNGADPAPEPRTSDIESTIEEIETFVKEIEDLL